MNDPFAPVFAHIMAWALSWMLTPGFFGIAFGFIALRRFRRINLYVQNPFMDDGVLLLSLIAFAMFGIEALT